MEISFFGFIDINFITQRKLVIVPTMKAISFLLKNIIMSSKMPFTFSTVPTINHNPQPTGGADARRGGGDLGPTSSS